MCQNCFNRGYNDYPSYSGLTVEHKVDYIEGYKKKQYEILEAAGEQNTSFCKRCFDNGVRNAQFGIWAPPFTSNHGHYESYEKGYYKNLEPENIVTQTSTSNNLNIYNSSIDSKTKAVLSFISEKNKRALAFSLVGLAGIALGITGIVLNLNNIKKLLPNNSNDKNASSVSLSATENQSVKSQVHESGLPNGQIPLVIKVKHDSGLQTSPTEKGHKATKKHESESSSAQFASASPIKASLPASKRSTKNQNATTQFATNGPSAPKLPATGNTRSAEKKSTQPANVGKNLNNRESQTAKAQRKHPHWVQKVRNENPEPTTPDEEVVASKQGKNLVPSDAVASTTKPTAPSANAKPMVRITDHANTTQQKTIRPAAAMPVATLPKGNMLPQISQKPQNETSKFQNPVANNQTPLTQEEEIQIKHGPRVVMVEDRRPFAMDKDERFEIRSAKRATEATENQSEKVNLVPEQHEQQYEYKGSRYYVYHTESEERRRSDHEPFGGKYLFTSTRVLSDADLDNRSKPDLVIMLNEIYARHNFIFTDDSLKRYFSEKYWYQGSMKDVSNQLSGVEKRNIELIKTKIK